MASPGSECFRVMFKMQETVSTSSRIVRLLDVGSKRSELAVYLARRLRFEDEYYSISCEPIQIKDVYTFTNAEIGVRTNEISSLKELGQ